MTNRTTVPVPPVRAFVKELIEEGWVIVPGDLLGAAIREAELPKDCVYMVTPVIPRENVPLRNDYHISTVHLPTLVKERIFP